MSEPILKHQLESAAALIFDMDGTLLDSMPLHFEAWTRVTDFYQLPFSETRFYQLGGVPTLQTLEILCAEAGKTIDLAAAVQMKEACYQEILPHVRPIPQILDIARFFHGHKPMAIATGASRKGAGKMLAGLDLEWLFDAVVTADDVKKHKPEPDVFLEAATRLKVNPVECVAFEDTDIGMAAIGRAGMYAVDVRTLLKAK